MRIHFRLRRADPKIRRWPYPFRAAVSISNDADFCSFEFFEALMRYCNTKRPTPFGVGLGLEVTSSFFGFSPPGRQFSYYEGLTPDAPRSECAPRIAEYLQVGWLDANHAFGDFDGIGGFSRAHAERLYEELDRIGANVRIFINHGDNCNQQCIGRDARHHRGDVPGTPEYHTDLVGSVFPWYVTTTAHTIDYVFKTPPALGRKSWAGWWIRRVQRAFYLGLGDRLLVPMRLRDGQWVRAFARVRGTGFNAPNLGSLAYQLELLDMERLYADEGGAVLYQHFGVLHRAGRRCYPATVEEVRARPELLAGLRRLANEAESGRLWVTGLQRMLDYVLMVENTTIVHNGHGAIALKCGVPVKQPERFFGGLTVYVDPAVETRLYFESHELPVNYNGPDQTGRYSVSVPLMAKLDIW